MRKLLLGFFISVLAMAGTVQRQFSATATTSWVVVSSIPSSKVWRSMLIHNGTNGDLAVAFGDTSFSDLVLPFGTDLTITNPPQGEGKTDYVGALSIKNLTGSGGSVTFTLIDNTPRQFILAKSGSNDSVGSNGATSPTSATLVAGQDPSVNLKPLQTTAGGALIVSATGPTPGNTTGSVCNDATVSNTAETCTAPANAVGFLIQASSSNTINLRFSVGATATVSTGTRLEPGRSEYLPVGANVSYIAESGSGQQVTVQWVSQ